MAISLSLPQGAGKERPGPNGHDKESAKAVAAAALQRLLRAAGQATPPRTPAAPTRPPGGRDTRTQDFSKITVSQDGAKTGPNSFCPHQARLDSRALAWNPPCGKKGSGPGAKGHHDIQGWLQRRGLAPQLLCGWQQVHAAQAGLQDPGLHQGLEAGPQVAARNQRSPGFAGLGVLVGRAKAEEGSRPGRAGPTPGLEAD